ncbi:MAG: hypothetical protein MJ180_03135 [Candidatus Gastranaerophilales bacterium]|nr:hypothetical protein [Candidatus Gastranaerophilales bacterium]
MDKYTISFLSQTALAKKRENNIYDTASSRISSVFSEADLIQAKMNLKNFINTDRSIFDKNK